MPWGFSIDQYQLLAAVLWYSCVIYEAVSLLSREAAGVKCKEPVHVDGFSQGILSSTRWEERASDQFRDCNSTKELLSWTHKREMVSSDVIKQGQWRAIYYWNRMDSCHRFTNGLLTGTGGSGGGGSAPQDWFHCNRSQQLCGRQFPHIDRIEFCISGEVSFLISLTTPCLV